MSQQMTSKVELELPAGPVVTQRRAGLRWLMLAVGLVVVLALPWFVYPPVAMDIAAWALFAISVDLLLIGLIAAVIIVTRTGLFRRED